MGHATSFPFPSLVLRCSIELCFKSTSVTYSQSNRLDYTCASVHDLLCYPRVLSLHLGCGLPCILVIECGVSLFAGLDWTGLDWTGLEWSGTHW